MLKSILIEFARRPLPLDLVLNIIERIKVCGLNTIHLHLTDDQGIGISSTTLKFNQGWTIEEQKQLASLCKKLEINIIPEIDIPGHSTALRTLLEGDYQPLTTYGKFSGLITLEQLPLILDFCKEVKDRFNSKYIHIGGDECFKAKKIFPELIEAIMSWSREENVKIIAWEDILQFVDPPSEMMIAVWKDRRYPPAIDRLKSIPNERLIFCNGYYVDISIDIFTSFRKDVPLDIGGCEACAWGELIDKNNLMSVLFPSLYILSYKAITFQ